MPMQAISVFVLFATIATSGAHCDMTASAGDDAMLRFDKEFNPEVHNYFIYYTNDNKPPASEILIQCQNGKCHPQKKHFKSFYNASTQQIILIITNVCQYHQGNYTANVVKSSSPQSCYLNIKSDVDILVTSPVSDKGCKLVEVVIACRGATFLLTPNGETANTSKLDLTKTAALSQYKCVFEDSCGFQHAVVLNQTHLEQARASEVSSCREQHQKNAPNTSKENSTENTECESPSTDIITTIIISVFVLPFVFFSGLVLEHRYKLLDRMPCLWRRNPQAVVARNKMTRSEEQEEQGNDIRPLDKVLSVSGILTIREKAGETSSGGIQQGTLGSSGTAQAGPEITASHVVEIDMASLSRRFDTEALPASSSCEPGTVVDPSDPVNNQVQPEDDATNEDDPTALLTKLRAKKKDIYSLDG